MITIPVNIKKAEKSYDILLADGLLADIGKILSNKKNTNLAVLTDDNVKALYLQPVLKSLEQEGFNASWHSILPGEKSKNADSYFAVLNWLAESGLTRSDIIVALGGGVVGDLAGFAAATYLRGITLVQVPTTLLAMVDSSVGGKTAIDLPSGKNLAGAFYQPELVLCDPTVLSTLSADVYSDGCAEVVKYGMIRHKNLLEILLDTTIQDNIQKVIETCVKIKRDVVQNDVFDTGERQLLNFGHTIGHAIERLSLYEVSHGSAVAIGMAIITRAAVRKNYCPPDCQVVLERLLEIFELPNYTDYSAKELYEASLNDKKRAGGSITEVVPKVLGECVLKKMQLSELLEWIESGLKP